MWNQRFTQNNLVMKNSTSRDKNLPKINLPSWTQFVVRFWAESKSVHALLSIFSCLSNVEFLVISKMGILSTFLFLFYFLFLQFVLGSNDLTLQNKMAGKKNLKFFNELSYSSTQHCIFPPAYAFFNWSEERKTSVFEKRFLFE